MLVGGWVKINNKVILVKLNKIVYKTLKQKTIVEVKLIKMW